MKWYQKVGLAWWTCAVLGLLINIALFVGAVAVIAYAVRWAIH